MDKKTRQDLSQLLDEKFQGFKEQAHQDMQNLREEVRQDMVETFNQGVREVIVPYLENIEEDLAELKGNMKELKVGLDNIEDGHERRLEKLESHQVTV